MKKKEYECDHTKIDHNYSNKWYNNEEGDKVH